MAWESPSQKPSQQANGRFLLFQMMLTCPPSLASNVRGLCNRHTPLFAHAERRPQEYTPSACRLRVIAGACCADNMPECPERASARDAPSCIHGICGEDFTCGASCSSFRAVGCNVKRALYSTASSQFQVSKIAFLPAPLGPISPYPKGAWQDPCEEHIDRGRGRAAITYIPADTSGPANRRHRRITKDFPNQLVSLCVVLSQRQLTIPTDTRQRPPQPVLDRLLPVPLGSH